MNSYVKLPSAFSLIGANGTPSIDNQGAIGSCASQSVSRNQFSNSVTRYAHSIGINTDKNFVFGPKFSYNMSGAGTAWVYEFIMDHGAYEEENCMFEKNENGGHIKEKDGKVIPKSAMWHVGKGEMKKALRRRLTGFEQIWTVRPPYDGNLTTSEAGRELLIKIKKAIVHGDFVVTGGYPGRWIYSEIENVGTYGKKGEKALVASAGNGGGGHQVTIVGYDDNITASFAGVTMKGAFIVANSYGEGWINGGYTYVMYDAVNQVSEYERLNDSSIFSGQMFLTSDSSPKAYTETLSPAPQKMLCTKVGKKTVSGEEFDLYTVKDTKSGKYLTYSEKAADRKLSFESECTKQSEFCFIPYEKLNIFPSYNKDEYKEEYVGSFWIYCPNNDGGEDGYRFVDAGLSVSANGRQIGIASLAGSKYPQAKSWDIGIKDGDSFTTLLGVRAGKDAKNERVWTFDQFCFTDWEKNVTLTLPELYAEIRIECANRLSFSIVMTRTGKDGKTVEYTPALFRYASAGCNPRYCKEGEYLTFSGKVSGKSETGYFALSYSELLKYPEGTSVSDYKWGFEIVPRKGESVNFKGAELYWGSGDIKFAEIKGDREITKKTKFGF